MRRLLLVVLCTCLLPAGTATASPRLCEAADSGGYGGQANQPRPNGVGVAYLYAKLDGEHWTEPRDVCVAITFFDPTPLNRYLQVHLWSTAGFYLDLSTAGIPAGTPIALGLTFPPGATPVTVYGAYRDGVARFGPAALAIQAKTAPWTYVPSAYNADNTASSGTIDCAQGTTTWPSTFSTFVRLEDLLPDGSEGHAYASLMGSYFEANTSNFAYPYIGNDGQGGTNLLIDAEGCGDHDPATLEGHVAGFFAQPLLSFVGIGPAELAKGSSFMSSLLRIRDVLAGTHVAARFSVARSSDLALDPIDGVVYPPAPAGPGPVGISVDADFSFSRHLLDFQPRRANIATLRRCTRRAGKVVRRGSTLQCRAAKKRRAHRAQ